MALLSSTHQTTKTGATTKTTTKQPLHSLTTCKHVRNTTSIYIIRTYILTKTKNVGYYQFGLYNNSYNKTIYLKRSSLRNLFLKRQRFQKSRLFGCLQTRLSSLTREIMDKSSRGTLIIFFIHSRVKIPRGMCDLSGYNSLMYLLVHVRTRVNVFSNFRKSSKSERGGGKGNLTDGYNYR